MDLKPVAQGCFLLLALCRSSRKTRFKGVKLVPLRMYPQRGSLNLLLIWPLYSLRGSLNRVPKPKSTTLGVHRIESRGPGFHGKLAETARLRRLFNESYAVVAADLKATVGHSDESGVRKLVRKLAALERAERLKQQ